MNPENDPDQASQGRRRRGAIARRLAFVRGGGKCSFQGCETWTWPDNDLSLLEVAYINAPSPHGPRYDPNLAPDAADADNYILLCPNHHRLIDLRIEEFPAEVLRRIRDEHYSEVRQGISAALRSTGGRSRAVSGIAVALSVWERLEFEHKEEFWQQLFSDTPGCLLPLLGGRAYELKGKCYVGGKGFRNVGGNILDFLAMYPGNSACIEIKTPGATLMSGKPAYRNNVYLPHDELVGACVQVLESRQRLVENLMSLNYVEPPEGRVMAPSPACYVIIGNLEREQLDAGKRNSFELYRSSLRDVAVVTFDELFNGLKLLLDSVLSEEEGST